MSPIVSCRELLICVLYDAYVLYISRPIINIISIRLPMKLRECLSDEIAGRKLASKELLVVTYPQYVIVDSGLRSTKGVIINFK